MRRQVHFAPGCFFYALKFGLLFSSVSLGPPAAKYEEMRGLGVLAQFVVTLFVGTF